MEVGVQQDRKHEFGTISSLQTRKVVREWDRMKRWLADGKLVAARHKSRNGNTNVEGLIEVP